MGEAPEPRLRLTHATRSIGRIWAPVMSTSAGRVFRLVSTPARVISAVTALVAAGAPESDGDQSPPVMLRRGYGLCHTGTHDTLEVR